MLPGPPTVYQSILDHPRVAEFDMSSLRLAVTGAAPVPVELIRRMRAELGFETIVTGYGLTEATGIATMCRHDDDPETISKTAGRAIPDVEVLRRRRRGNRGARGRAGRGRDPRVQRHARLHRRSRRPPRRRSTPTAGCTPATSACMDERGYIRITDRTKDMFIVGGFNAYPAEIENMINEHPAVGQVAIVGVPDERMGEVGYAYVVPRPGATIDRRRADALVPREDGQLQGAALLRDRRRAPAQRERQGPQVRAPREGPDRSSAFEPAKCAQTAPLTPVRSGVSWSRRSCRRASRRRLRL